MKCRQTVTLTIEYDDQTCTPPHSWHWDDLINNRDYRDEFSTPVMPIVDIGFSEPVTMDEALRRLESLWMEFSEMAQFDDDEKLVYYSWHEFPVGTSKSDIWRWFEAQHPEFSVAKIMGLAE